MKIFVFAIDQQRSITIDSNADTFQWEISTDGGINWTALSDDITYSGVNSTTLLVANISPAYEGHQFRVQLQRAGNSCTVISNAVTLTIEPLPIVEPVVELSQCDNDTDGLVPILTSFKPMNSSVPILKMKRFVF